MMDLLEQWLPVMAPGGEPSGGSGGGEGSGGAGDAGGDSASEDMGTMSGENFDIPLGDDLDSVTLPEKGPEGPQSGAKAAGTPGAAAGQQQTQPVAPSVAPAAPVQQQQTRPVAESEGDVEGDVSPESVIAQLTESSEAYAEHFGNELFGLSQEEVEALQVNPEVVLPRLMGRVLVQAMRSIPHQIMRYVPGIIEGHVKQARESFQAENEFLAAWPGLSSHRDVATKAIQATIAAYGPGVLSRPDLIRYSGMLAFQMLGHQAPPMGGAPAQGGGVRPQQRQNGAAPFVPAGSAASASGGPAGEADPWSGFTLPE
jgi:hypothetical protein